MVALPFSPVYPLAAFLYGSRLISARMAMPVRQSYTMGIIEAGSRGSAAGVSGVARRLPASVSPTISGYWLGIGELELPFMAAAACSLVNAALYFWWFREIRPDDEPGAAAATTSFGHSELDSAAAASSDASTD